VQDFQVRGQVMYVVPFIGWVRQWAGGHATWAVPAAGVALIVVGLIVSASAMRGRRDDAEPGAAVPDGADRARRALIEGEPS